MKVKLGDIRPNPFRDLTHYVMDEEKITALVNSIESTSFWSETVLVRKHPDGGVEQAFGHHRIEAARRHLGVDAEVEVTARKLDDADMLRMMAEENLREWKHDLAVQIQTVQAVIDAAEAGVIELPEPNGAGGRPSEFSGSGKPAATSIAAFLGGNWSFQRVSEIAKHITYFGEDAAEELKDIAPSTAAEIVHSAELQAKKAGLTGEERKQAVRETTRDYAERVKRGEHRILDQARQDAGKKPKHDVGNAIVGDDDRRAAFVAGLTYRERNLLAREIRAARNDDNDMPMYAPNEDTEPVFRLMALLREGQLTDWITGVEDKFEPALALLDRIARYREQHGDDMIDGEFSVASLISDSLIELREKVRQAFDAAMGEDNFAKEILG